MPEFARYKYSLTAPTAEDVAMKIKDCRAALGAGINGAPLCEGEALRTAEDYANRYSACMECFRATSNARGLVGHTDEDLKKAFAHIDGVLDACTASLGAASDPVPPPVPHRK